MTPLNRTQLEARLRFIEAYPQELWNELPDAMQEWYRERQRDARTQLAGLPDEAAGEI